jgi:hypothetical protein
MQNKGVMIHNHEVGGSFPPLATKRVQVEISGLFLYLQNEILPVYTLQSIP